MTFQYFFFDTYPGYFVEALPLAMIVAAVDFYKMYGGIKTKCQKFFM